MAKCKNNVHVPDRNEFLKGCEEFEKHENRDSMYKVATFLIRHFWGKPIDMADGLGVLLLTWNQAFYRYGMFDFDQLEECINRNFKNIEKFNHRDILSFSDSDEEDIRNLFNDFLDALQTASGKKQVRKSPVAVAKALHLLAPKFFPLWDEKIARAYGCYYNENPVVKYISFCKVMKAVADKVKGYLSSLDPDKISDKTLIKLIDEYNYSKYTKGWI